MKNSIIAIAITALFSAPASAGKPDFQNGHDNRVVKTDRPAKSSSSSNSESSATASSSSVSRSKSRSSANSSATGGNSTGGNAEAAGGAASATGGNVIVSAGAAGSGLTGRMVPDVSAGAPLTSTSCRNGISAGGSGNGWGGLLGFFAEDDMCEWRLLEASYRSTDNHKEANAIRRGMTAQRCRKLSPEDREAFGDLCPKQPAAEQQSAAFSSAG